MGTKSFSGVKVPGYSIDDPPPFFTKVKEREQLYLYSTSELSGMLWGDLNLYI